MSKEKAKTPLMEQYLSIKAKHKDSILFFRMGDFYEMFFEDAKIASEVLGITLTSRAHGKAADVDGVFAVGVFVTNPVQLAVNGQIIHAGFADLGINQG